MDAYGIDLGTTNSCISIVDEHGVPRVIRIDNSDIIPSIVYFDDKGNVKIGNAAKNQLLNKPDSIVTAAKRRMGERGFAFNINGKEITPVEVSSHILKYLVDKANELRINERGLPAINKVVITVPAYFEPNQRDATKKAGELAGLEVLELIDEPTAAGLSYGLSNKNSINKTVLVYDLGGGTFDATIMRITHCGAEMIAKKGDEKLGGIDWDKLIVKECLKRIDKDDISEQDIVYRRIIVEAERAKQVLTEEDEACVSFVLDGIQNIDIERSKFEQISQILASSTLNCVEMIAEEAKLFNNGKLLVDELILVGGSSRMPMIQKGIQKRFGITPKLIDPDLAISKGAALYAANFSSSGSNIMITKDIDARSYGIGVSGSDRDYICNLIFKNEPKVIEERIFTNFSTKNDDQTSVAINIYSSESKEKEMDRKLGKLVLDGSIDWGYKTPKGRPVKVTIKRDKNGILNIIGECEGKRGEWKINT